MSNNLASACPICQQDSGITPNWDNLSDDTLTCASCGVPLEIECEEIRDVDEDIIYLTLVRRT